MVKAPVPLSVRSRPVTLRPTENPPGAATGPKEAGPHTQGSAVVAPQQHKE